MDEQAAQIRRELDGRLQLAEKIAMVRNTKYTWRDIREDRNTAQTFTIYPPL